MADELDQNIVGMCKECFSIVPTDRMANDPFAAIGEDGVCRICGGPVTVIDVRNFENIKRSILLQRGITDS